MQTTLQAGSWAVGLSPFLPFIVQWVKNSPLFPNIRPETKGRVIAVGVLVAASLSLVSSLFNGDFNESVANGFLDSLQSFVVVFGVQELVYRHIIKRFEKKPSV